MPLPKNFSLTTVTGDIDVPSVAYGTITESCEQYSSTICNALKGGVRHLNCAWEYGVNKEIGDAIRESGVPREEIFVTHKINPHFYDPQHVGICANQILTEMGLQYVDLLVLHLPVALKPLDGIEGAKAYLGSTLEERRIAIAPDNTWIVDAQHSTQDIAAANGQAGSILATWRAMQALVTKGKTRAVGVSNFSIGQLKEILEAQTQGKNEVPLSANEIEIHPYHPNIELRHFMHEHNILALGHSSFAAFKWLYDPETGDWPTERLVPKSRGSTLLENTVIRAIAEANGMAVGQVLNSWAVQSGAIPSGRSTSMQRILQNLDIRRLPDADMDAINQLECQGAEGQALVLADVFPGIAFPTEST